MSNETLQGLFDSLQESYDADELDGWEIELLRKRVDEEVERLKRENAELSATVNVFHAALTNGLANDVAMFCPEHGGFGFKSDCAICNLLDKAPAQSLEDYCTGIIEDDRVNKWKSAVIEALVVDCIYRQDHDTNPKAALNELLCYERKMVLDPQISEDAYDYGMRVAEAVQSECADTANKTIELERDFFNDVMADNAAENIRNIDLAPIVKGVE